MPSGKLHPFLISSVSNEQAKLIRLGKAGRNRWQGRLPIVRGVAMNPIDHPHGGGEGKTSGGRPSVTSRVLIGNKECVYYTTIVFEIFVPVNFFLNHRIYSLIFDEYLERTFLNPKKINFMFPLFF